IQTALHQVSLPSEWSSPLWVLTESLRSLSVGFLGAAVVLGGGVLAGVGWLHMLQQDWRGGGLVVLPPPLAGATMLGLGHYLWPRFFFFAMGFALLIVVHGALTVPRLLGVPIAARRTRAGWGKGIGLVLACVMIVASGITVPRCYTLPKQDFRGAR